MGVVLLPIEVGKKRKIRAPGSYLVAKKWKRLQRKYCNHLKLLARPAGLEPATHGLEGRWSFANPAEFLYYLTHIFL